MSALQHYTPRRWHHVLEEIEHDGGPAGEPLRKAAVAVVVANPYAGEWVESLEPLTAPSAELGTELGRRAAALLGLPVQGYGKGGIAGIGGEQEHVVACVTTIFGDAFRDAVGGGAAWISSVTKLGGPGTQIDIPLAYKDEVYVRSHYDSISFRIDDAPRADELLIAVAVSSGPRVHARVGGMTAAEAQERRSLAAEGANVA
ncbi:amino acid synthesis family protein [Agrococcus beijingensis]|uniref:amino acid synthesis family protein n=1 Tax=Agrococcus beijingensis TaxID=3068634 RepID=UPI00274048B0|nr:amino acid synthesis family protein [Agrococcus sp. REN33]